MEVDDDTQVEGKFPSRRSPSVATELPILPQPVEFQRLSIPHSSVHFFSYKLLLILLLPVNRKTTGSQTLIQTLCRLVLSAPIASASLDALISTYFRVDSFRNFSSSYSQPVLTINYRPYFIQYKNKCSIHV